MEAYEEKTGGSVLAIAHNGNLSNGRMFPVVEAFGKADRPRVRGDARQVGAALRGHPDQGRRRGASLPFAQRRVRRLRAVGQGQPRRHRAKTKDMLEFEYARSALKLGLKLEQELGTNPYKFGMVGSSDAHTGLAAMEEDNFFGKTTPQEPSPERLTATFMNNPKTGVKIMDWEVSASGYAAVWATENTRESHLGRDGAQGDLRHDRLAHDRALLRRLGLRESRRRNAQPRGGRLQPRACRWAATFEPRRRARRRPSSSPRCKDPIGANLDRIQIVKGWIDTKGELHEKVYDVVWGGRPQARREEASSRAWEAPSMSPTRPGRTRSARPS